LLGQMQAYAYCGYSIQSEHPFESLAVADSVAETSRGAILVVRDPELPIGTSHAILKTPQGVLFTLASEAAFLALESQHEFVLAYRSLCRPEELEYFLTDQVLPRAIAGRNEVVLHGATLAIGDVALGLVGHSGAGKSTLARALSNSGAAMMGDDVFAPWQTSGGWQVAQGALSTRLRGAGATQVRGKARRLHPFTRSTATPACIVAINPVQHAPTALRRLRGAEAVASILSHHYTWPGVDDGVRLANLTILLRDVDTYVLDLRHHDTEATAEATRLLRGLLG